MSQIEVEVRGPLSKEQYDSLSTLLKEKGSFLESKHRILVDYSTLLPEEGVVERKKDIRLRITNGRPEIITKIGRWGGKESRKEISIFAEEGSFDALIENYAVLGYTKGVLCVRNTEAYTYNNIELALVEVPEHSHYFEAEVILQEEGDVAAAHELLQSTCAELKLETFDEKAFFEYIAQLNKEANEVFDFEKEGPGYFKKRFSV